MAVCVNCCVILQPDVLQYEYYAAELSPDLALIIEEWCGREISDNDRLCQACVNQAAQEANNCTGKPTIRLVSHILVCISCGISLGKRTGRRRRTLVEGSDVRKYIQNQIFPQQSPAQVDSVTDAEYVPGTLSSPAQVDSVTAAEDVPGTLSVSTSPAHFGSATVAEDVPGTLSSPAQVDSDTDAEDVPGTLSEELEEETINENKMKLFCPKCHTEVSHIAKAIEEDLTKILIAKVYHYFEQEYEELKMLFGDQDWSPLSKFYQRTALATGVSETTLLQILKEEEGRYAKKRREPPKKRRAARKRRRQTDSSSEEDGPDDNVDDIEQPSHADEILTLVVKLEPPEDNNEEPEIFLPTEEQLQPGSCELNKAQLQTDPISVDVKTEPQHYEVDTSNETLAHNQPVNTKRKRRKNTRKSDDTPTDDTLTLQHTHGEASAPGASSRAPLAETLDKSGRGRGEREINVQEMELVDYKIEKCDPN